MKIPDIFYKIARKAGVADKPVVMQFPREVDVGLTNSCNLKCSFCLNGSIKKNRGFMEESLFKSLADCLADKFRSKTNLGLGLFGEATLHPKFIDFLNYASWRGLKIHISTNFVSVSREISQALIDAQTDLVEISFYTLNKENYNKIVGVEVYDHVLENIHSFLADAEKSGFNGQIRLRPFSDFAKETPAYQKEFYQKYPNLHFDTHEPKTMANWAGFLKLPKLLKGVYMQVPCSFPFSRMTVDWDGEVRLCCNAMMADDLIVGRVMQDYNLYDLWNGQKFNEIREKFSKINYKDFPSCPNCYFSRRYFPLRK
ncbi:MAG: SPASM domain-containing protein [bacterium]|nr:SPASM domain-containing protein [bacterium]